MRGANRDSAAGPRSGKRVELAVAKDHRRFSGQDVANDAATDGSDHAQEDGWPDMKAGIEGPQAARDRKSSQRERVSDQDGFAQAIEMPNEKGAGYCCHKDGGEIRGLDERECGPFCRQISRIMPPPNPLTRAIPQRPVMS